MANTNTINNPRQLPSESILDRFDKQTYLGQEYMVFIPNETIPSTSTEVPLCLLANPPYSTKALFNRWRKGSCTTPGKLVIFRFYINPTVTSNGTLVTPPPLNMRPACGNTAIATAYTQPTVSALGIPMGMLATNAYWTDASERLAIIDPGNSMLVTVETNTTSPVDFVTELGWYEL